MRENEKAKLAALIVFLLVLAAGLLPREAKALPITVLVSVTVTDTSTSGTTFDAVSPITIGTPPVGTIFWQAELFGNCTDGIGAAVTGCSLSPSALSPALARIAIDGVTLIDQGTALSFPGAGPNNFSFGPTTGSFDCTLVAGCDQVQFRINFTGSGGNDAYVISQRLILSDTPFGVPEPGAALLFGAGAVVLGFLRRFRGAVVSIEKALHVADLPLEYSMADRRIAIQPHRR